MTSLGKRPAIACLLLSLLLVAAGCETAPKERSTVAPPPPTYLGPQYLHGTVGSMVRLRNSEPLLVSGYGIVVNLNGTGSSEVPTYMRQWLINEMKIKGLGSARLGTTGMSPNAVLASTDTAVVAVRGLIPAGAVAGSRFDVLVEALPNTQTTSLEGGQLWTVDLAVDGLNPSMRFSLPLAQARGATFLNPLAIENEAAAAERDQLPRRAVVLSGGVVTESRRVELILNQRSWLRSRAIADAINQRIPRGQGDHDGVGEALTDTTVAVNIPKRYVGREEELLGMVSHLFVTNEPGFAQSKAQQLANVLVSDVNQAPRIIAAWSALGKTALPTLRTYYTSPDLNLRIAAMDAGVRLGDPTPTQSLLELSRHPDANVRSRVAQIIVGLPRSLKVANAIKTLLDDDAVDKAGRLVRLVAYEALAKSEEDGMIQRVPIGDPTNLKFVIDLLPSNKPMVYVRQQGVPRIVIFQRHAGFKTPLTASLWEGRLRLLATDPLQKVAVFYQRPNGASKTFEMAPTVANLALLLAQPSSITQPNEAPNLGYSHVVNAVHSLHAEGYLAADFRIQPNELAEQVEQSLKNPVDDIRPETSARSRGYEALATAGGQAGRGDRPDTAPGTPVSVDSRPAVASDNPDSAPSGDAAIQSPPGDPANLPPAQETYLIPAPTSSGEVNPAPDSSPQARSER